MSEPTPAQAATQIAQLRDESNDPALAEWSPRRNEIVAEIARLDPIARQAAPARTLHNMQRDLAARPNDEALIVETRNETARVLGDRNTLPANGAPSSAQIAEAQKEIRENNKAMEKLIPGSKPHMALLERNIALSLITNHDQTVARAQQGTFTELDVDRAAKGVIASDLDVTRFKAAAAHLGASHEEQAQLLFDIGDRPVPPETEILNLDDLWGDQVTKNIDIVKKYMTRLRRYSEADHNALFPWVERDAPVANRVLKIAKRQEAEAAARGRYVGRGRYVATA